MKDAHRFVLNIPGLDSTKIQSVRQLDGNEIEVTVYWLDEHDAPAGMRWNENGYIESTLTSNGGTLHLHNVFGEVTDRFIVEFAGVRLKPLDCDYCSLRPMSPKIVLFGATVRKQK